MKHKIYKAWEDIAEELTPAGMAAIKEGQILIFEKAQFKVMHKTAKRLWVKEITTYTPDEFQNLRNDEGNN